MEKHQVTYFPSSVVQSGGDCVPCGPTFLYLAVSHETQCGLLLLCAISLKLQRLVHYEMLFPAHRGCEEWLFMALDHLSQNPGWCFCLKACHCYLLALCEAKLLEIHW